MTVKLIYLPKGRRELKLSATYILLPQQPNLNVIERKFNTSRLELSAVQVLKIRRPNYSDFSVKTMVIMKLLQ